jgi:hypothetical protein
MESPLRAEAKGKTPDRQKRPDNIVQKDYIDG